jgi:sporulation protein YlmC with PRC-barrel domain
MFFKTRAVEMEIITTHANKLGNVYDATTKTQG